MFGVLAGHKEEFGPCGPTFIAALGESISSQRFRSMLRLPFRQTESAGVPTYTLVSRKTTPAASCLEVYQYW